MRNVLSTILLSATALLVSGCVTPPPPKDYSKFRSEDPHSILVLPALNNTVAVEAPEFFFSTVSQPFAQRGYYAYPANMVKSVMENEGLADPALIYSADTTRLGNLFGCDAALYLSIEKWESQYVILATSTNVSFDYELRSCKTGEVIWTNNVTMTYSPQASSSGNLLVDLVAQAAVSAIEKGMPNYIPLARQANLVATTTVGQGIPAGPYLPENYESDLDKFPISPSSE